MILLWGDFGSCDDRERIKQKLEESEGNTVLDLQHLLRVLPKGFSEAGRIDIALACFEPCDTLFLLDSAKDTVIKRALLLWADKDGKDLILEGDWDKEVNGNEIS